MGGREPWLREDLHNLIREFCLFRRERRRISVPVQTSANVRTDLRTRTRDLVRTLVQLAHLLEQRLKLHVVDRHELPTVLVTSWRLGEPVVNAPDVLFGAGRRGGRRGGVRG